ncbi:LVIVD repeat-containing protein [Pontibacter harenae]|uniref:LVIVD repeat-containing protein n=1 Tax=Pontibacter harenae TaxID=2894083 RepID=UPI001E6376C3|nr:hypothetical protein [Pontibacter harenae]MCC9166913.1 hypothetical protein [Pontibacter harenae]
MEKKALLLLRFILSFLFLVPLLMLNACTDECETTITYNVQEPVYMMRAALRNAVQVKPARTLTEPGKIYAKDHFLFINEIDKGIHIIDNSNPSSPQPVSFIEIPGNVDMAVKGNILYADSYIDLVALDISNPQDVQLVKRIENIFPTNGMLVNDTASVFVASYETRTVTHAVESDCNGNVRNPSPVFNDAGSFVRQSNTAGRPGNAAGKGGSMARFSIVGDQLYTVSISDMQLFDISNAAEPREGAKISLGWGIETIFPYEDKLFIGSTTGMHIYDNSNPTSPVHLSSYAHVRSCDPVVVEGDLAWVTLRSGNACAGFTNQLDVINISNPRNPQLVKTYPMQNPHGLGIDNSALFLCEGEYGLKVFDVKDHLKVSENLKAHMKEHDAYDVIPLGNTLLMIGKDGLYQYDYSDLNQIKLLSKIPVIRQIS